MNKQEGFGIIGILISAIIIAFLVGGIYVIRSIKQATTQLDVNLEKQTSKEQLAVFGLFSKSDSQYKIFKQDLSSGVKEEIYSVPRKINSWTPVVKKFVGDTILIEADRYQPFLIDLSGNLVKNIFTPPSAFFYLSPKENNLLYHKFARFTDSYYTVTIRDMTSGREFLVEPHGKEKGSRCDLIAWKQDGSEVFCHFGYNIIKGINTKTGVMRNINIIGSPGSLYYPESNLEFINELRDGKGVPFDEIIEPRIEPPWTVMMVDTVSGKEKVILSSPSGDIPLSLIKYYPETNDIIYVLGADTYQAKLNDIDNTKEKIISDGGPIVFSKDRNYIIFQRWTNTGPPYIDKIFVLNRNENSITELYSFDRSEAPEAQFTGLFEKN